MKLKQPIPSIWFFGIAMAFFLFLGESKHPGYSLIMILIFTVLVFLNNSYNKKHFKEYYEEKQKERENERKKREKERLEREKIEKAKIFLTSCGIFDDDKYTKFNPTVALVNSQGQEKIHNLINEEYSRLPKVAKSIDNEFVLSKKYSDLLKRVMKDDFDEIYFINELFDSAQLILEKKKIEERSRKHKIKLQAEKEVYGKEKNVRKSFSNDEKDEIIAHFDNQCAICGANEGLHIHHKDQNPSHNQMKNLIVLCGVCHKKVHMNVR